MKNLTPFPVKCLARPQPSAWNLRKAIVFEDEDYLCINKPPGVLTTSVKKNISTVETELLALDQRRRSSEPSRLITRLSKEASGLVLAAKTQRLAALLTERIRLQTACEFTYWAVVRGRPVKSAGSVNLTLGYAPKSHNSKDSVKIPRSTTLKGQSCLTQYKVMSQATVPSNSSSVPLTLVQISTRQDIRDLVRAHCAFGLQCPILGDDTYTQLGKEFSKSHGFVTAQESESSSTTLLAPGSGVFFLHLKGIKFVDIVAVDTIRSFVAPVLDPMASMLSTLGLVLDKPKSRS